MKKQLQQILSIVTALSLLVSAAATSVFTVGATEETAYQAELLEMLHISKKSGSPYNNKLEPSSNALTPDIPSPVITINWDGATNTENSTDYLFVARTEKSANGDEVKEDKENKELYRWPEGNGLMFYVKAPAASPVNGLYFTFASAEAAGTKSYLGCLRNKPVYYLQKGTKEWATEKTTNSYSAPTSDLGGSVPIPAGFEGWVRIPYESICHKNKDDIYYRRINMYLEKVGGDYTDGGFQLGAFMWVKDSAKEYTSVKVGKDDAKSLLVEFPHHKGHMLNGAPTAVGDVAVELAKNETAFSTGYTYAIAANAAASKAGAEFDISADENAQLKKGGSLIFYAGMHLAQGNTLGVEINGTKLTAGSTVYTAGMGIASWESATVGDDGSLALPAAFEGYVMVPAAAWGIEADTKLDKLSFIFDAVPVTEDRLRIGSALLSDSADSSLQHVRLDDDARYVLVNKKRYYHAEILETGAATSTPADQTYFEVSDKNTGPYIVPGLNGGYDYEFSIGSVAEGSYKPLHPSVVDYYTATMSDAPAIVHPGGSSSIALVEDDPTGLTPTVPNWWAKWLFDPEALDVHNSYDGRRYQNPLNIGSLTLNTDNALMFYLKLPAAAPATPIGFQWNSTLLKTGAVVYLLPASGDGWQPVGTTSVTGRHSTGYIPFTAGFEGWVRIPYAAMDTTEEQLTVTTLRLYLSHVDSTFTNADDQFSVGGMCMVNKANENFYKLNSADGSITNAVLQTEPVARPAYNATLMTGMSSTLYPKKDGADGVPPYSSTAPADTEIKGIATQTVTMSASEEYKKPWAAPTDKDKITVDATNINSGYIQMTFSDNITALTANNGILFHLSTTSTEEIAFSLGVNNASRPKESKPYYLLADNGTAWETRKVSGTAWRNYGYLTVPAGFSGWVRVPSTVLGLKNNVPDSFTGTVETLMVSAHTLGGKYGTLTVGAFMIASDLEKDTYFQVELGDTLVPLGDPNVDMGTVDDSEKYYNVNVNRIGEEKTFNTDALLSDMCVTIPLANAAKTGADKALMFYVRQTGRVASEFRLSLGNAASIGAGAKYMLYSSVSGMWRSGKASADGRIAVDGGFEGWIRIPFAAFVNEAGAALPGDTEFDRFYLLPCQLGGCYGTLRIGTFMLTDFAENDLNTMRVGIAKEQNIAQLRGYTGSTPAVQRVKEPVGATATRVPRAALAEGYIYELSAKEQKNLHPDMGFELLFPSSTGTLGEGRGVLAYVKVPESKENTLAFGGDQSVMPSKEWYFLAIGEDSVWQKSTANEQGGMDLPAGFEGYVRVPAASMKEPTATASSFRFAFAHVGGEYGSPLFGSVTFIDRADCDYTMYYSQALSYGQSLHLAAALKGYVLNGTAQPDLDKNGMVEVTKPDGNPLTPQVNGGYAIEISAKDGEYVLDHGGHEPCIKFVLDSFSGKAMSGSESLMFYVKTDTANSLWLQMHAENYAAMKLGNRYYTLAKGDAYWTTGVADRNGNIVFEEGFEGWVRIPYTEFKTSLNLKGMLTDIRFAFRCVGGEYGNPQIGTLIMAEHDVSSGQLQLFGSDTAITLYGDNQKAQPLRDDVACWESVTIPYVGYAEGEEYPIIPQITETDEIQSTAKFTATVTEGLSPFKAPALTFFSDKTVQYSDANTPYFLAEMGVSTEDGVGLVMYVKLPKVEKPEAVAPEEEDQYADNTGIKSVGNNLWLQFNTIQGRTLSLRHVAMLKTLQKGETSWKNTFVDEREILLPNGFEGYIYIPFEALGSVATSSTGTHFIMERDNMITRLNIAFGEYGGETGDAIMGGLFLAKNDALSHNGAYVDGSTVCRDVFTGETVEAEQVKESVYDAPVPGESYLEVPEATDSSKYIYTEGKTFSSVTLAWLPVENATRYRVDVYRSFALTTSFNAGMGYEHMYSMWVDEEVAVCEGLLANNFYLIQVLAFNGDEGIEILPATSAVPEGEIVGGMWSDKDDDYKYPWFTDEPTDDSQLPSEEDQPTIEGDDGEEEETIIIQQIIRKKKAKKRWLLPAIIGGSTAVAAGGAVLLLLLLRRKKKMKKTGEGEETK